MANTLIEPKDQVDYGQQQALDAAQSAVPLPVEAPVDASPQEAPSPQTAPAESPPPPQSGQPAPFAPRSLMQLVPPDLLYRSHYTGMEGRQKLPAQAEYDAGLLWKVLANDPRASEMTKVIAKRLLNEG